MGSPVLSKYDAQKEYTGDHTLDQKILYELVGCFRTEFNWKINTIHKKVCEKLGGEYEWKQIHADYGLLRQSITYLVYLRRWVRDKRIEEARIEEEKRAAAFEANKEKREARAEKRKLAKKRKLSHAINLSRRCAWAIEELRSNGREVTVSAVARMMGVPRIVARQVLREKGEINREKAKERHEQMLERHRRGKQLRSFAEYHGGFLGDKPWPAERYDYPLKLVWFPDKMRPG